MKQQLVIMLILMGLVPFTLQAETGVSRAQFTTAIENKEPVSKLGEVSTDVTRVYYFTELRGLSGHTITHRWEYQGQVMADITFNIEANRWRTWSSKNMLASWTGTWQVSVLDEGGNILEQSQFEYHQPVAKVSTADEAATPEP